MSSLCLLRVLCAAGRGVALEALGVGEELAGRLGVAVRRRDGVALAVVAVGLRRFEHEADVREVRVVGIVVVGAVDRDVLDHQAALLRDDDARCRREKSRQHLFAAGSLDIDLIVNSAIAPFVVQKPLS